MLSFAQYDFGFFFLNEKGKRSSFFQKRATLEEKALFLDGSRLYFEDIYLLEREDNKIVFVLYPAVTVSKTISDHILPYSNSFVIEVERSYAFDIKSRIDHRYTAFRMKIKEKQMIKKGEAHNFRTVVCPQCAATIDFSYKPETTYIYCGHCKTIFKKSLYERDPEAYRICPQCEYYNRVQLYTEVDFYLLPKEESVTYSTHYVCDSCAQKHFKRTFWKNMLYVVAAPFAAYAQLKSLQSPDPLLQDLTPANLYASEGEIERARPLYEMMLLRTGEHPGVLYSYAKACLDASLHTKDKEQMQELRKKAVRLFERTLKACANYTPLFELLRENANLEYIPDILDKVDLESLSSQDNEEPEGYFPEFE
jgi:ribosomal protein L37AE/L43A